MKVNEKAIISLYDYSGNWSEPYKKAGYKVVQIDIKTGDDVFTWPYEKFYKALDVKGILIAQPCTDFALSGAKHFKLKDKDGRTAKSIALVKKSLKIVDFFKPEFWVLENPMSRIHKLVPELGAVKFKFNPCDFAGYSGESEAYNKMTWLWGNFNLPVKKRIEPINKDFPGFRNLGGKSERTKELRSITPKGFAYAFFEANH
jgi:hypothetical protein